MKIEQALLLSFIIVTGTYSLSFGQIVQPLKSIISIENQFLYAKIDNPIRLVAQQPGPVTIDQLSATFQVYDSVKVSIEILEGKGYFIIHPDTTGIVEIKISIGDTIEIKFLRVKAMEAVGRLGRFRTNSEEKVIASEFKAQMGIHAVVECCGFDAKCKVLGYEVIRINNSNQVEKSINKGSSFEKKTAEIIDKAAHSDIFIFRNIKYKCPGSGNAQRLDDMIFEIE